MKLQEAYYNLRFENVFLRAKGDEFQTFFECLMGLAYKEDFMACRPWGKEGDRKNDGFLKSERRFFQVYAPNEMKATEAIKKITEDFEGAKAHWGKHFDIWVFVHNAVDGLPPHVHQCLLDFESKNEGITLQPWGLEELRSVFRRIPQEGLTSWLGHAPTEVTKARLGFKDLQVVLESLAAKTSPYITDVKAVPAGKIEANDLSESVVILIKNGMTKTPLVSNFLESWYDETLGDRLAAAFRAEYDRLHSKALHPNRIYSQLQEWAGGSTLGSAEHQMAVFTVLAYYFERCDIFEEPRDVPS